MIEREQFEMFKKQEPSSEPIPIRPGLVPSSEMQIPNPYVITHLESLLSDARSGKLQGIFAVGESYDGMTSSNIVGDVTTLTLGAVELEKFELMMMLSEDRRE